MPRKTPPHEIIRKRVEKWKSEEPATFFTKHVEKVTSPLQQLVETLVPQALVCEVVNKTLWAAEVLTDRSDVFGVLGVDSVDGAHKQKIEKCDGTADGVHNWAMGAAAVLGAFDLAGPLAVAPALASLFTLSFRTLKKIALCYGYSTQSREEELIVLELFALATSFSSSEKKQAISRLQTLCSMTATNASANDQQAMQTTVTRLSQVLSVNLARRRALAGLPVIGIVAGGSLNAWLLKDLGWTARNFYSMRRFEEESKKQNTLASVSSELKAA